MAREIRDFQTNDVNLALEKINSYLLSEGYKATEYAGENVYKKGNGVLTGPTFFKFAANNNIIRMEAWMKFALLPGVYVGESDLSGAFGAVLKDTLRKRIDNIERIVYETNSSFSRSNPLNNPVQNAYSVNRIFCQNCGKELDGTSLFCTNCGARVEMYGNAPAPAPQFVNQPQNTFAADSAGAGVPGGLSEKEYVKNYLSTKLVKDIKSIAILCYVCAAVTAAVSVALNPYGIIDAAVLCAFALGMQFTRRKVFAILILVLSIIEVVIGAISGAFSGILWLAAGIWAVVTFKKVGDEYKAYLVSSAASQMQGPGLH